MKKRIFIFIFLCAFFISACKKEESSGPEVLILATFENNSELKRQVDIFNQSHHDYQIEIQNVQRSLQPEEDDRARLQREIMSGAGPDIIDFGGQYTISDITGGYTENLFPYLEKEVSEYQRVYFDNILRAYCYQDNLYAMPIYFSLHTFAGSKRMLGGRENWNADEMMMCYSQQKEGCLLYPGQTKRDVFATILTGSMEYYIDWEQGTCSFDQGEFEKVMEFANSFPESLQLDEDFSVKKTFSEGGALVIPLSISNIYDICNSDYIFNSDDISYVGFPVEGACGTVIRPSAPMLAISISSKHKEVCWEFISQFLDSEYLSENNRIVIRCDITEEKIARGKMPEYELDEKGNEVPVAKSQVRFDGDDPIDVYCLSKEQAEKLMQLIGSATICAANDYQLYNILLEEGDSFFSGDKELAEVVDIIQNRSSVYVSERTK